MSDFIAYANAVGAIFCAGASAMLVLISGRIRRCEEDISGLRADLKEANRQLQVAESDLRDALQKIEVALASRKGQYGEPH